MAAIIVATMVGVMGGQFIWQSFRELVDTGISLERVEELSRVIDSVEEVRSHHDLRTRLMAGKVLVDVHILVSPWISASEGHRIGEEVRRRLILQTGQASRVMVHVDTQAAIDAATPLAPLRQTILTELHIAWRDLPETDNIERTILHYESSQVRVELHLCADGLDATRLGELEQRFETAATLPYLDAVHCLLLPSPSVRGPFQSPGDERLLTKR